MENQKDMNGMNALKNELKNLLEVVPAYSKVIFVDYPIYGNIGDLLIMHGTENFFEENNIKVLKRYSRFNFNFGKIDKDVIIICQGGGNFGDLYPEHQVNREKIIQQYPSNRIVILPQTIYYEDIQNINVSKKAINKHKDLHIFTRDNRSYELAKKHFTSKIYTSPDMAHSLWKISVNGYNKESLNFIRTDTESNDEIQEKINFTGDRLDWQDILSILDKVLIKLFIIFSKVDKKINNFLPVSWLWRRYSKYLIRKCAGIFSKYKLITTSRLHGHILACLIERENILLDNSYGKNSSYYTCWTSCVENSVLKEVDPMFEKSTNL